MKKTLSLLLAALLLCGVILSFGACAKLDTTGLAEAAPDLIARSVLFNEIYFGDGIPYNKNDAPAIGAFYYANPAYLAENGFSTVEQLKTLTKQVFSAEYSATIFQNALEGYAVEGTTDYSYARYSSNQALKLRDEKETILVNEDYDFFTIGKTTYDYASLTLGEVTKDSAVMSINVSTVYAATEKQDEFTTTDTLEITFVYENGWRIDSPTY